jgi:hypothetical protein
MPDLWMGIKMLNILVSRLQFPVFNQLNPTLVHICERAQGLVNLNMAAKNLRRPRNSHGRRLPKEGDAGGKGTWGKLGDEMELPWVSRI